MAVTVLRPEVMVISRSSTRVSYWKTTPWSFSQRVSGTMKDSNWL